MGSLENPLALVGSARFTQQGVAMVLCMSHDASLASGDIFTQIDHLLLKEQPTTSVWPDLLTCQVPKTADLALYQQRYLTGRCQPKLSTQPPGSRPSGS